MACDLWVHMMSMHETTTHYQNEYKESGNTANANTLE